MPQIFDDEEGDDSNCSLHFDETIPPIFDEEFYIPYNDSCCDTISIPSVHHLRYLITLLLLLFMI